MIQRKSLFSSSFAQTAEESRFPQKSFSSLRRSRFVTDGSTKFPSFFTSIEKRVFFAPSAPWLNFTSPLFGTCVDNIPCRIFPQKKEHLFGWGRPTRNMKHGPPSSWERLLNLFFFLFFSSPCLSSPFPYLPCQSEKCSLVDLMVFVAVFAGGRATNGPFFNFHLDIRLCFSPPSSLSHLSLYLSYIVHTMSTSKFDAKLIWQKSSSCAFFQQCVFPYFLIFFRAAAVISG